MSRIRSILSEHFPEDRIVSHGNTIVFSPDNEDDIVSVVNLAGKQQFRICSAGTMSHLDTDDFDENVLVVSTKRLDALIEYSPDDLYITVGAGMKLRDVNSHVTDSQLSFKFGDLDYKGTAGGAVALGLTAEYDNDSIPIKRLVPSLTFVTPYGKLIRVGAVTLKSVAGYDIPKLLVGSRGQFGIITSITLRLSHSVGQHSLTSAADVGQDSLKPATSISSTCIKPRWGTPSSSLSEIELNLKSNLDPHGIFPVV